jgi:hypothetical protein
VRVSSQVVCTVLVSLALVSPVGAKCARLVLEVAGEVRGDPEHELTLRIATAPDANERQQAPSRDGDVFQATLLFDPTKGYSRLRGHDCSRDPRVVRILLLRGEAVLQEKELAFANAFVEEAPGVYRARERVILEGDADAPHE